MAGRHPVADVILISGASSAAFDSQIEALLARAATEAGLAPGSAQVLGRIPRAGTFVVQAPEPLLSRLAEAPGIRSIVPQNGRSAFIPPVRQDDDPRPVRRQPRRS